MAKRSRATGGPRRSRRAGTIAAGARWLAERLAAGDVDHAVFQAVRQLLDGRMAPDQAVALAEATLARCELGEVRLALGDALVNLGRKAEAEAAYRWGLAGTDEPDVRTRLLVSLGNVVADRAERRLLLHGPIELSGNLVSAAMATILLGPCPTRIDPAGAGGAADVVEISSQAAPGSPYAKIAASATTSAGALTPGISSPAD